MLCYFTKNDTSSLFFCIDFLPLAGCKEEEFTWTNYLRMTKAQGASKELFASPGRVTVTIYNICMNIVGKLNLQTRSLMLRMNVFNCTLIPGVIFQSRSLTCCKPTAALQRLPVCCLCLGGCQVRLWHRDEAGGRGSHESVAHLRSNRHRCGGRPFPGSFWQLGWHIRLLVRQHDQFGWFSNW